MLKKVVGEPDLSFVQLREANLKRLPLFKNKLGQPAHTERDGSDWSIAEWTNAVCGEAGEAANEAKKIIRGDYAEDINLGHRRLALELADIIIYADLCASRIGVDLGEVVREKFNIVSERVECHVKL